MKRKATLNHTFRTVWNDVKQAYVPVAETVKAKGKPASQSGIAAGVIIAALGLTGSLSALAAPEGGLIVSGNGTISQNGTITTVEQSSQTLKADWQSFNINADETVNFVQPDSTSLAVNTILDSNGSRIMGKLNANGQVWLINPNGIYFGQSATVNVGSILASTLNPLNGASNEGTQTFAGNSTGSVINAGNITAYGGYVALLSSTISANHGQINAENGAVAIASGTKIGAKFADNQLVTLVVEESTLESLAENKQLIQADGGTVIMTAGAKDSLIASVVNNEGKIQAKTVQHKDGKIILMGGMEAGTTKVAGTLDASAENGDGGFIETSAADIQIADDVQVTTKADNGETGEWLIDPRDFNINANGGSNNNKMNVSTLQDSLANNNVTIETTNTNGSGTGDINVKSAVTWNSANTLTLKSRFGTGGINIDHNITFTNGLLNLNATGTITAAGAISGKTFDLKSGTWQQVGANLANFDVKDFRISNGTFIRAKGGDGSSATPYQLTDVFGLQGVGSAGMLDKNYTLANDIDASGTTNWNSGAGFDPIGTFTGKLDGLMHEISGLYINRLNQTNVGLFAATSSAEIKNLGLAGGNITVSGNDRVGGIIGFAEDTNVKNVYSSATVQSDSPYYTGGLIGRASSSQISDSYATGDITGYGATGGLVGTVSNTVISNSYATGNVKSTNAGWTGGLVAELLSNSEATNVYATGDVEGSFRTGGLIGLNFSSKVENAYATGKVTGTSETGGLIGRLSGNVLVKNTYASGQVSGTTQVGGLIGSDTANATIENSFWNTQTSGQSSSAGGTGKNTAEMQTLSTFTGWDIDDQGGTGKVWRIYDGHTSPLLRSFMTGLDLGTTTVTYNNNSQTAPRPAGADANLILGTGATGTNAGTYNTNYYSTQQGYDLSNGHLVIEQLSIDLTAEATAQNKVYDGNANASVNVFSNDVLQGDTVTFGYISALFDDKNVANGKTVTVSGISKGGADAGNYVLQNTIATTKADITALGITVDATAFDKTYDGNKTAIVDRLTSTGIIGQDQVSFSSTSAAFSDKNAATNKTVTVSGISASGADAGNYSVNTSAMTTADIYRKNVTLTVGAENKVYDGNTGATATFSTNDIIQNDDVSFGSASANFDNKNVGQNKVVTVLGINASGNDVNNYNLALPNFTQTTANITPKTITVTATASDKVYDATKAAAVALNSDGIIDNDDVSFSGDASFGNKKAKDNKKVTVENIAASGADADNYSFNTEAEDRANITRKAVDLSIDAENKVYDGNTDAAVNNFQSSGVINGDTVNFSHSNGEFEDKHVGTDKEVSVDITATGKDAANYAFKSEITAQADITPKTINVSVIADDKVYDGNKKATVDQFVGNGVVSGDEVNFDFSKARFDNKNAGENKLVTVTGINASGNDAGNYAFGDSAVTVADIDQKSITVDVAADDKVYDGNRKAVVTALTSAGIIGNDDVSFISNKARFDTKDVGTDKTVTVSGLQAVGVQAGNYLIANKAFGQADITPKTINVSAIADEKVYDGNRKATLNALMSAGIIGNDDVSFNHNKARFDNKNVGIDKTVTVKGISASGTDAGNYQFSDQTTTLADITAKLITVDATAYDKIYDGNRKAQADLSSQGIVSGDNISFDGKARFGNKHAGLNKKVTVKDISASGADAGNYSFNAEAVNRATISKLAVKLEAVAQDKVYDGNKTAIVQSLTSAGILSGDAVAFSYSNAEFADKNVGADKKVEVTGIDANGSDARNYAFLSHVDTQADITLKTITVDATAYDKIYDGNRKAQADLSSQGIVSGDNISFDGKARFGNKHAGLNKKVTVKDISASGADAGNYSFNAEAVNRATISKLAVKLEAVAQDKVYDGNKTAIVQSLTSAGILSGDAVAFSYSNAEFADKNVGADKKVEVTGIDANGSDARNYAFLSHVDTQADITLKTITVDATAYDKIYDGNRRAKVDLTSAGVISGDDISFNGRARFGNKHAALNKKVTVKDISAIGVDAGNYSFNAEAVNRATISKLGVKLEAVAQDKVYDGNKTAIVQSLTSAGILSGDAVAFSYSNAEFEDKNVGADKKVEVTGIDATGSDARNYAFLSHVDTQADITAKNITVAATAQNKVYDGLDDATAELIISGLVSGDDVSFDFVEANFDNKNVGQYKPVTVTGISANGIDAGNYWFSTTTQTNADITPKQIVLRAYAADKVYDGTTDAWLGTNAYGHPHFEHDGMVAGDNFWFSFSNAKGQFSDKNVGQGKQVKFTGVTAHGIDKGNYTFDIQNVYSTADITPKHITLRAYAADKVYDGTTDAWLGTNAYGHPHFEHDGMVAGDNFWFSFSKASGQFSDKNVGNGKQVKFTGVTANGADKGNYSYDIQNVYSTANITPKQVDLTVYAHDKVYDDNANASLAGYETNGIVSGDQAWVSYDNAYGGFDNKQVGVNKTVTFTGMQLVGADQGNYRFEPAVITTADIIKRQGYTKQLLSNFKGFFDQYMPEIGAIILNEPKKMSYPLTHLQDDE